MKHTPEGLVSIYVEVAAILEMLDSLRIKAMDKKTPVTGILDSIHQIRIILYSVMDDIDDSEEAQKYFLDEMKEIWESYHGVHDRL